MCRERLLAHVQQHALLRIHEHRLCRLDAEQSLVEQMRVTQVGAEAWDDLRVAKAVMQCVGVPAYCRHHLKVLCCQRQHRERITHCVCTHRGDGCCTTCVWHSGGGYLCTPGVLMLLIHSRLRQL